MNRYCYLTVIVAESEHSSYLTLSTWGKLFHLLLPVRMGAIISRFDDGRTDVGSHERVEELSRSFKLVI